MKQHHLTAVLFVVLTSLSVIDLSAHRHWLLPSTSVLSGTDQWVSVEGAVSNDLFFPNHVPIPVELITVVAPDGSIIEKESLTQGSIRSSFEFKVNTEGTYVVTYMNTMYFASWKEHGEIKRWRGSKDALKEKKLEELPGVKLFENQSRVQTVVTCGLPDLSVFELEGHGLEVVPIAHPNDLFVGDSFEFEVYLDGQAVEGVEIAAIRGNDRFRDQPETITAISDAEGKASFVFNRPGRYWLNLSVKGGMKAFEGKPMATGYAYTVVFEVFPE